MKKIYLTIICWQIIVFANAAEPVTQEIRYFSEDAKEVYLVWGINNWQTADAKQIPAGSYIKDNLVYTRMSGNEDGLFSVILNSNQGSLIDYVFWITKGPLEKKTDIWDTNVFPQKDYHTYVVSNTITLVESKIKVQPKEALSVLDFSYLLLISAILLYIVLLLIKKYWARGSLNKTPVLIVVCAAISLMLMLFITRPSVLGLSWDIFFNPLGFIPEMFWSVFYDFIYVSCITLLFLLLLFLFKRYPAAQTFICSLFVAICFFSLIVSVFNIRVVEMLGKPFNYQWLYYSNFLKSDDAKAAISANVSITDIARTVSLCGFGFFIGAAILKIICLISVNYKFRKVAITVSMLLVLAYGITAHKKLKAQEWSYDRLANPVTAFMESVNPFAAPPALFTMDVPDSLQYVKQQKIVQNTPLAPGKIKNVIVFVMESTPAEYIETYGSKYNISPVIKKYEGQSVTFENMYAHAPATNLSMVSLLGSVYPWLSYNSLTEEHPDMRMPTISSELKQKGYRTAFFNSADNRYQKAGEFLGFRKFDVVKDYTDNSCNHNKYEVNVQDWDYMSGKDDNCSGEELNEWIRKDRETPFFSIMWTFQTHYPYFFKGQRITYDAKDSVLNRYLNALHYGDSVLGNVIDNLKQNGLFESTLVVVIGDHGEAFGRHEQITHGRKIYEENMHIPCIMINPAFEKTRVNEIGGMIDVAPTIMNLIGYAPPVSWDGENLFDKTKDSRVFFFAPWSDFLFGFREGDYKYIYNATKNETEIYNLKTDPYEQKNISVENSDKIVLCHQKMAGWAQFVNKSTEALLKN
ncbi:MAG: sulfatase [Bacteroidota bacterium]